MEGGLNEKLRDKVEFKALKDFGNNISNKFVTEMNQKLDKKELLVKTSRINKKVKTKLNLIRLIS